MRRISLSSILCCLSMVSLCSIHAQQRGNQRPSQPKTSQPQKLPDDVRKEIVGLSDNDPGARGMAIANLMQMGSRATPAIPYLIALLGDANRVLWLGPSASVVGRYDIREIAAKALAGLGQLAVEALLNALKSTTGYKGNIIWGIGEIAAANGVDPLIILLDDKEMGIRFEALAALGKIKDHRAIEPLVKRLAEEEKQIDNWMTGYIKAALRNITGEGNIIGEDRRTAEDWQLWWAQNKERFKKDK